MLCEFSDLKKTFKSSIKTWNYLVDWNKVNGNFLDHEIALNKLNYLLGKRDIKTEFIRLYESNPDVATVLPLLAAVRENKIEIYNKDTKESEFFDFTEKSASSPSQLYSFLEKTRLVELFREERVKNLVDYARGVEVGLDSNGRKNRGGKLMENIVEEYIKSYCEKNNFEYIAQAQPKQIKREWGYEVKVDKSNRSFDFAIYNPQEEKIKLFEVNFYNGGGSKLKAVCGEFRGLFLELYEQGIDFIWITDGLGWKSTLYPLEETFNHNDGNILNLSMLEEGVLDNLKW